MSGGKIGDSGIMQRKRSAQQGRNAALGHRKVTEADCMQLERNRTRRGSFRLLRGVVAIGIDWESQKMRRYRRRRFNS
jgi:hypothetical protein